MELTGMESKLQKILNDWGVNRMAEPIQGAGTISRNYNK